MGGVNANVGELRGYGDINYIIEHRKEKRFGCDEK